MNHSDILFPYEKLRPEQERLVKDVKDAIDGGMNLLAHAPTGLGKTIAVLGPALKQAMESDKTVFFLTSRHTQHILAIRTLKDIQKKYQLEFNCCDIIGKKWMCSQLGAENMPSSEFTEYCKALRNDELCEFFQRTKNKGKTSPVAENAIFEIKKVMPADTETINRICKDNKICPYEVSALLARESKVIIADYNYIFNDKIREGFFLRANKKLEESIIIIDEGHNLPSRLRSMMSERLSTFVLERAIKEAQKFGFGEAVKRIKVIMEVVKEIGSELDAEKDEDYVLRGEFYKKIDTLLGYDETKDMLENLGDDVREQQRSSYIGSVSAFMDMWIGDDRGYCRTIKVSNTKYGKILTLKYSCMDPSLVSRDIVNGSASTILMSGTLTPTEMYADILGFRNYNMNEYNDPFSEKNRLNLIIEEVSTKYTVRNSEQYKKIASILADIINTVSGNSFVFFPSYDVRNQVHRYFESLCKKKIFLELKGMSKEEKKEFLEKFKLNKKEGGVMLGVASGSFGEGVDLPGDLLECVIVVGVPLSKPDLETKDLIQYYDDKYGQGINYGYMYPAITKTMQNAGRCIRSEKDRGVIVFMDARYSWENYKKCFPTGWDMKITKMWKERIERFFSNAP